MVKEIKNCFKFVAKPLQEARILRGELADQARRIYPAPVACKKNDATDVKSPVHGIENPEISSAKDKF